MTGRNIKMLKTIGLLAFIVLLFVALVSCGTPVIEGGLVTPSPGGSPAPMVHVDGRIYNRCPIHGARPVFLDETFEFIGEVTSYSWLFRDVTENLQGNSASMLGARLYKSGEDEDLIAVVINEFRMFYRFTGDYIEGWTITTE